MQKRERLLLLCHLFMHLHFLLVFCFFFFFLASKNIAQISFRTSVSNIRTDFGSIKRSLQAATSFDCVLLMDGCGCWQDNVNDRMILWIGLLMAVGIFSYRKSKIRVSNLTWGHLKQSMAHSQAAHALNVAINTNQWLYLHIQISTLTDSSYRLLFGFLPNICQVSYRGSAAASVPGSRAVISV